tara:strand:+ start:1607 stop:2086 length:480 start_codon:yes stop_codon:yes gene_type:complete
MTFKHTFSSPSVEEKAAELLPPDWYDFEIVDAFEKDQAGEPLVTKQGDPFLKLRALETGSGTILYHYLFFSESGAARIDALLHATGASAKEGEELTLQGSDFVGKSFRGKVEITHRNGKQYNSIARVRKPEASQAVEEDPPTLDSLQGSDADEPDEVPF